MSAAVHSQEADQNALPLPDWRLKVPLRAGQASSGKLSEWCTSSLDIAQRSGATAIHPGCGLLSENSESRSKLYNAGRGSLLLVLLANIIDMMGDGKPQLVSDSHRCRRARPFRCRTESSKHQPDAQNVLITWHTRASSKPLLRGGGIGTALVV